MLLCKQTAVSKKVPDLFTHAIPVIRKDPELPQTALQQDPDEDQKQNRRSAHHPCKQDFLSDMGFPLYSVQPGITKENNTKRQQEGGNERK